MNDAEMDEMLALAERLISGKGMRWYERLVVRSSDRIQLATLAVVLSIHKQIAEAANGA